MKTNKIFRQYFFILSIFMSNYAVGYELSDVVVLSLKNDIKIQELHNELLIKNKQIEQAEGEYLPQIGFSGTAKHQVFEENDSIRSFNQSSNASIGLNFEYFLYDNYKDIYKTISDKEALVALNNLEKYKQDVMFNVSKIYYMILSNEKTLKADQENLKALKQEYKKIKSMYEVGLKTKTDLTEVQAQVNQAETNVVLSKNDLINSKNNLYIYTGMFIENIDYDINFEKHKKNLESKGFKHWFKILKENNYDIKNQILSKEIAKNNINSQASKNDFKISLNGGISSSYNKNDIIDYTDNSASVGITLSFPLFDGNVNDSQVSQARIAYQNESLNLDYLYRNYQSNLQNILSDLHSLKMSIKSSKKLLQSSKEILEAMQISYEVGVRDITDVLNANTNYYINLKNLANIEYQYLTKQNELLYLVGILNIENIQ